MSIHYHPGEHFAHPGDSCGTCEPRRPAIEVNYRGEPEGEVFASNSTVHIEQIDKGIWWVRIDQHNGGPSLVGHLRSKKTIHATWEWDE